jgi:signal transduction histidine kinase
MVGMTERAAALGGQLEVGPGQAGGFRVFARIPVEFG